MARTMWFKVAVAVMTEEDTDIDRSEVFDDLRDAAMDLVVTAFSDGSRWSVFAFGEDE